MTCRVSRLSSHCLTTLQVFPSHERMSDCDAFRAISDLSDHAPVFITCPDRSASPFSSFYHLPIRHLKIHYGCLVLCVKLLARGQTPLKINGALIISLMRSKVCNKVFYGLSIVRGALRFFLKKTSTILISQDFLHGRD